MSTDPVARFCAVFAAFGLLLGNFTLFYISGFPFNGAFMVMIGLAIVSALRFGGRLRPAALLVVLVVIVIVALKIIGTRTVDESVKSAAQIILAAICLVLTGAGRGRLIDTGLFGRVFAVLMVTHAFFMLAQFAFLNLFGSFALQNPFGVFSAIGPLGGLDSLPGPYLPHVLEPLKRTNGFFSEPSVAATYSVFALACLMATPMKRRMLKLLLIAGLAMGAFIPFALTGWAMLVVVVGAYVLVTTRRQGAVTGVGATIAAVFAITIVFLVGQAYLFERIDSASEVGSSIYIRFTGPFRLLSDVLGESIVGLPLNDPYFLATRPYLVDFAGRRFVGLDNFYLWMATYFGLPGLMACLAWLTFLGTQLARKAERALPLLVIVLFAGATGAGYSAILVSPLIVALSYLALAKPGRSGVSR